MARVTGIGGIFFKARDVASLTAWYRDHLGIPVQDWGGAQFTFGEPGDPPRKGYTVWSLFKSDSDYFGPSGQAYMMNLTVDDLPALLAKLRAAGCAVDDKMDESEYGRFGWVTDPEGNRVELWEPPAE